MKRLLVSPDASLVFAPLGVLVPDLDVSLIPSASVFATLRSAAPARGVGVLALGNPDYSGRPGVAPLPETEAEVESITPRAPTHDERLLGADATATRLRARLGTRPRWQAVHLACHGIARHERPRESYLALSADEKDAGRLHAYEVFDLEVPADLVVLSGCSTGQGSIIRGEGLEGLPRAFMFAGVPRVIASLWKVEDAATRALMTEFYRLWRTDQTPRLSFLEAARTARAETAAPKWRLDDPATKALCTRWYRLWQGPPPLAAAEALRRAQAHVRDHPSGRWAHPDYWGAWVLWGLPN